MSYVDTWTVFLRRHRLETWWTIAGFGKATPKMVRRMTKPTPDMTYPTYAVGDADKDKEVVKVAAVTGLRSDTNQVQDLLRRIVSAIERPTPTPDMSDIRKMLLQLTREQPVEPAPVVDAPVLPTLEQKLRSVFDGQHQRE